jgi:hypothetical protein
MGACVDCTTNADLATAFTTGLGTAGIMFDLVATTAVKIVSFEVNLAPGTYDIAIYFRDGGYMGFDADASAWTQVGTATGVVSTAGGAPTAILLPIDVVMPASAKYGWYITSTLAAGGTDQVLYGSGTAEGAVQLRDAHLQLLEGRAKEYPFAMPYFPRQWNGIVHYIACD